MRRVQNLQTTLQFSMWKDRGLGPKYLSAIPIKIARSISMSSSALPISYRTSVVVR